MTYLAVNKNGEELVSNFEFTREENEWSSVFEGCDGNYWPAGTTLPAGSIKKLIGKELTWNDEPFEII